MIEDKKRIIKLVHKMVGLNLPSEDYRSKACLLYAEHTIDVLKAHGVRAIVQSGNVQWPRVDEEQDDGVIDTHFSYMWETLGPRFGDVLIATILSQKLPEFHCWVAIPETQEIIDLTTKFQVEQCKRAGMEWLGKPPPDYIWCKGENLPDRTIYRPIGEACIFADALLKGRL